MIVGRVARNFATHGVLSFNLGERVSSVTSPLFCLLSGLLSSTGMDPLVAAKVIGITASILTCLLLYSILRTLLGPLVGLAAGSICILLPPTVAYATGGLETSLYTLVCCLALERLWRRHCLQAMLAAAFSVLVRPDGAILLLVAGLSALWLLRSRLLGIVTSVWPGFLLLVAGLALHRLYYGTLLPLTVTAKTLGYAVHPLANAHKYLAHMLLSQPAGLPVYALAVAGVWYA